MEIKMNYGNYTVSMPYSKLQEWQNVLEKYNSLMKALEDCFTPDGQGNIIMDTTKLKQVAINHKVLALRYQDCNFIEVK